MATKNWLQQLENLPGAVNDDFNPHEHVIRTASPSINFAFGGGHGIGAGLSMALAGPPKGGKSLLCNMFVGQLHADDPNAIALKYNTEYRERAQGTPESRQQIWGIDPKRYKAFECNSPMEIFDKIETDLAAKCQDGMPLKLIIIDSIGGIQGRRSMNADSISVQQIGDLALTLGEGFKRILPVQRKYGISVILTVQVGAELDQLEIKRGNKVRMKMPFAVQHYCETFAFIEANRNVEGRKSLDGEEFKNDDLTDMAGNSEQTGHKIKMKIKDSSVGPKGRVAEFTLDYKRGLINVHEEVFGLGTGRGVILRPTNITYKFQDQEFRGKQAMLNAIKENPVLAQAIVDEVNRRDNEGAYDAMDVASEDDE